jgi:hypothetical protein
MAVLELLGVRSQTGCEHEHLRNRVIQLAHSTLVYDLHEPVRYSPIL